MVKSEDQYIINYLMGDDAFVSGLNTQEFSYISNPDGTIRWIYPKSLKIPMFLNFYSISSWRAKILSFGIKLAFFLGLSRFIKSGDLKLQVQEESLLSKILAKNKYDGFSIFTGTIGDNRKAILEIHKDKHTFIFVKIALTESSKKLVKNEIKQLEYLKTLDLRKMVIPQLVDKAVDGIAEISNVKPNQYYQDSKLGSFHIDALSELYSKTYNQLQWSSLQTLQATKENISFLTKEYKVINTLDAKQVQTLANNSLYLLGILKKQNETVYVSTSHGDFTPWNIFLSKDRLHVFDWELSNNEIPILYDIIHFVFQSKILIKKQGYQEVLFELRTILKKDAMKKIIDEFNIDFNKYYMFYLVYTISYYLKKYVIQDSLHTQVFWMISVWEKAIEEAVEKEGVVFNEKQYKNNYT